MTNRTLLQNSRAKAVRVSNFAALRGDVMEASDLREGKRREAIPGHAHWDDFFNAAGVDLGERNQPPMPDRDAL